MAKAQSADKSCPMETALNILSGKWRLKIIWKLMQSSIHFNELQRQLTPITTKTLSRELHELEKADIVSRTVFNTNPPTVEYSLTERGESLDIILQELCSWGKLYTTDKN